jgi:YesN/AraC family two-component response regulator
MNILIVDDDMLAIQGVLSIMDWERLGIKNSFSACSYDQALGVFQKHRIDLLLSDIEMPGGSGLDLIQWASAKGLGVACIILSSYPNFRYAQRAISLNVFAYLLKPVEEGQLETALIQAIARAEQKRSPGFINRQADMNPTVERIRNFICDNISVEINRDQLSDLVGLSPEYLSNFFRKETGKTLSEFIKAERISFSQRLLGQTNLPIGIISSNVGYDSLAYFSSIFKQIAGCTPREYRKNLQKR